MIDADGLNAHAGALERLADRDPGPRCSPRTRASWAACSRGSRRRSTRTGSRARARRRSAAMRRRAEGRRHDRRRAGRAGRGQRGLEPGAGDRGHRRRAGRHDRALLARGLEPFDGGLRRRVGANAARGVAAAERVGAAESVIASDVIDAIPAGLPCAGEARRRAHRSGRDRAQLPRGSPQRARGRAPSYARSSRRTATATARRRARGGARRRRHGWRSRPPPRRRSCAPSFPDARMLVHGRARRARSSAGARGRAPSWRSGARRFRELARRAPASSGMAARVHVKYDSGMGRLGERDPTRSLALVDAVAADEGSSSPGFWTHFATADERGRRRSSREQLERFRVVADAARGAAPGLIVHAANSAATLREPGLALRHGALRGRDLRARSVRRGPARRRASSRRWSCAPTSPT